MQIALAGHERGHRPGISAPAIGIVRQAEAHQQRAQVRVANSEFAKRVRIGGNLRRRIRRVVDENILREDHDIDRAPKSLRIKTIVVAEKLEQVQRREIARRVVEMHVLGAGIRGIDPRRT